ncbi:MAG: hypothetical protein HWE16_06330 [Gammaproteobacteria bacterium]|nr:hypothetical protein [Gammaproteobacteria bacterium]
MFKKLAFLVAIVTYHSTIFASTSDNIDTNGDGFSDIHENIATNQGFLPVLSSPNITKSKKYFNRLDAAVTSYDFSESGTVRYVTNVSDNIGTWSSVLGHIEINYDGILLSESFPSLDCLQTGSPSQVRETIKIIKQRLYKFSDGKEGLNTWNVVNTQRKEYPDNPECSSIEDDVELALVTEREFSNLAKYNWKAGTFISYVLNKSAAQDDSNKFYPGAIKLNSNNTGFDYLNDESIAWSIEKNKTLVLTYANSSNTKYTVLEDYGFYQDVIVEHNNSSGEQYISLESLGYKDGTVWSNIPGRYQSDNHPKLFPLAGFSLNLAGDGSGTQGGQSCLPEQDPSCDWNWSESPYSVYSWIDQGSNVVKFTYYYNEANAQYVSYCNIADPSCKIWRERYVELIAKLGNKYLFKVTQAIDFSFSQNFEFSGYVAVFNNAEPDTDNDTIIDVNDLSKSKSELYNEKSAVLNVNDINNDGVSDVGYFAKHSPSKRWVLSVRSTKDSTVLKQYFWNALKFQAKSVHMLWDFNGDGLDEVGLFAKNLSTQKWSLQVLDGSTGKFLKSFQWSGFYKDAKFLELADTDGDNKPEIALFGLNEKTFKWQYKVLKGETNKNIRAIEWYASRYVANDILVINDLDNDGVNEVALFGFDKKENKWSLFIRPGLEKNWEMKHAWDINYDIEKVLYDNGKIYVVYKDIDNAKLVIEKRDVDMGGLISTFKWDLNRYHYNDVKLMWDQNSDGDKELGLFVLDNQTNSHKVLLRSSIDASWIRNFEWTDNNSKYLEFEVINDQTGNSIPEISILKNNSVDDKKTIHLIRGNNPNSTIREVVWSKKYQSLK